MPERARLLRPPHKGACLELNLHSRREDEMHILEKLRETAAAALAELQTRPWLPDFPEYASRPPVWNAS